MRKSRVRSCKSHSRSGESRQQGCSGGGEGQRCAQKEVQKLQRVMEPKRARTHTTTVDDDEECEKQSWEDWDLPDHRREATRIQNRRSTPLGSRGEVPTPQEGKTGPLEHSRLGIVGWITYWSLRNCGSVVMVR